MKYRIMCALIMITPVFLYSDFYQDILAGNIVGVKFYIDKFHFDINTSCDGDGNTPLMVAAWAQQYDLVKVLLGMNANKTIKNKKGQTALDIAQDIKKQLEEESKHTTSPFQQSDLNQRKNNMSNIINLLK